MNQQQLRIAVINGGNSAEADVSRSSARGVVEALRVNYSHVESIELDAGVTSALANFNPDLVFPILHGPPGEDGTVQGFLEILNYSYVGSGVHASACAMDKIVAKQIFREAGLPLIDQCVVTRDRGPAVVERAVEKVNQLLPGHQVVVKPACQGSALGITMVENSSQLHAGIEAAFKYDDRVLVERRIDGREITVGVIDTDKDTEAFPVIEIITPKGNWYDFEHRYTVGLSEHVLPAELPDAQNRQLQQIAIDAHNALGCRDLSRADFIVTTTDLYLLEVNTLPGMTPTSLYPDGAQGYGMDFPALVSHLASLSARRRH